VKLRSEVSLRAPRSAARYRSAVVRPVSVARIAIAVDSTFQTGHRP
jgi:hypothetical protein